MANYTAVLAIVFTMQKLGKSYDHQPNDRKVGKFCPIIIKICKREAKYQNIRFFSSCSWHPSRSIPDMHFSLSLVNTGAEESFRCGQPDFFNGLRLGVHHRGTSPLPFRCDGISLLMHNQQTSNATSITGAAITENAQQEGPENVRPFSWPGSDRLHVMFQAVHDWSANDDIEEPLTCADTLKPELLAHKSYPAYSMQPGAAPQR